MIQAKATLLRGGELEIDGVDETSLDAVVVSILKTSFLKKEAAQDKHDARLEGQMNEPELFKKLWHLSKQSEHWDLPIDLKAICHPGLMRQKGRNFLKTSADACIMYKESESNIGNDDSHKHTPLEIKTVVDD